MSKMSFFTVLMMLLFTAHIQQVAAAPSNQIRSIKAYNKKYVYLADVARYYGMSYKSYKDSAKLQSKYSDIDFIYGKRQGKLNGIVVNYLNAPFSRKGEAMISEKDFLLMIDPILRYKALKKHNVKTIVIDAGHGGKDHGTSGKYNKEKDIALSMSRKLRWLLKKSGYSVVLTRDSDVKIPLEKRPELANQNKGDLFISIHCNSAGSTVKGVETYCLTPAGTASTRDVKPSSTAYAGNANDKNNARLAFEIHRSVISKTRGADRGTRHARFVVLKTAKSPAILIETGYLSNSEEEKKLSSDAYQNTIVNAIYEGIVRYHREVIRR